MTTSNKIALGAFVTLLAIMLLWAGYSFKNGSSGIFAITPDCVLIVGSAITMNESPLIADDQYREMLDKVLVVRAEWYEKHPPKNEGRLYINQP